MKQSKLPLTLKETPAALLPVNRMIEVGDTALSDSELLSLLIESGTKGENVLLLSERILANSDGLIGLSKLGVRQLSQIPGIGAVKAARIRAAFEFGRRWMRSNNGDRIQVRSPADVANVLMADMQHLESEQMRVLMLDTKNFVIENRVVYSGSLNTAVIRIGEIFRHAIAANAAGIILAHNHPSGDPTPSPEDIRVTQGVVKAGELMDITVMDHIVVGKQRYISMKEKGLGF